MYKTIDKRRILVFLLIISVSALVFSRCAYANSRRLPKARSASDIAAFLGSFGWEVEPQPVTVKSLQIPAKFTPVYADYNDMQKRQGFDLSKYRADIVESYTFRVLNHPASVDVFANVLVYRNRIIGGDICSFAINGFMTGFDGKSNISTVG